MEDFDREAIDLAYEQLSQVFGEGYPQAATLKVKGDGIIGHFVRLDEDVDLKTGFAPVSMLVLRAIAGVWHGDEGVERARKGEVYSVALMHATLKNRIDEAMPIMTDEVVGVRRGRVFESTFNPGQNAVAYDVVFPQRPPADVDEKTGEKATKAAKGGTRGKRQTPNLNEPPPPPPPTAEPTE
jgi:hypothetical protein